MNNKTNITLIALFLTYSINSYAQNTIQGFVSDTSNTSLYDVNVVLINPTNNNIVNYTFTDKNGKYKLEVEGTGLFQISYSHISHIKKVIEIELTENQKSYHLDAVLKHSSFYINEIIVQSEIPMVVKEDTISYKTKHYTQGNEKNVEELLKKIPGLQIGKEGTIKIGNKEIEKLMVEGDDLFEKGYKILSKNMPAYPIEEVEVLNNYSNNRLLKDVEESNKVALNLKLNEKSKRIWFGNIDVSVGNNSHYLHKGNLMNFGKKNKYYFFTNLNNIGYDATGDINHLIRPFSHNEPSSIGDNQQVNNLLNLSQSNLNIRQDRTNYNNAKLASFNTIFNLNEKTKIKTLGFFNWDKTNFYKHTTELINLDNTSYTNKEDYLLENKHDIAFSRIDITHNISKTKMLNITTKYNNGDFHDNSNLIFMVLLQLRA